MAEVRPDWRPESTVKPKRRTNEERSASALFKHVVDAEPCIGEQIPGHECEFPMQAMHVVSQQTLRKRGLAYLVWDPINGVNGCYRIHRRHDTAVEKIPRHLLPARCFAWAEAHHVLDALERQWPA